MKIQFFYDLLSPHSWIGYQAISFQYGDMCIAEKNYQLKLLSKIADHYNLEQGNFERMFEPGVRSRSALLFLNVLRNGHPRLQPHFMERFWHEIFVKGGTITVTNDFLRVARESDIQFSVISDIVMETESRENVLDFDAVTKKLIVDDRAIAFPWIKVKTDDLEMSFSEILRLELVDEIVRDPLRKSRGLPGIPLLGQIFSSVSFNVREEVDGESLTKKIVDKDGEKSASTGSRKLSEGPPKKKHKHHKHKGHHKSKSRSSVET
ncbi:Glutathione S-transferase kappa 1 [Aphelenchoides bicaudatus]|nr:Glutathione S-transferase kappa 1 [Aphelenchoides bicaudatus]